MGRYYSGDIEGKFWFGVQDSDDADFFGVIGDQPNILQYYFDESNLDSIKAGIAKCTAELGDYKSKFDAFFASNNGYNEEMLVDAGFPKDKVDDLLVWYARLELGDQILKCFEENGSCAFNAEYY